jgi:uncharacterized membrane protein
MHPLVVSSVVLLLLDAIFLKVISKMMFGQIMDVQKAPLKMNYVGAVLCYAFLIFGLYYFILKPRKPVLDAFLLGLVIYGVYESTSYAILEKWRLSTVALDTLWGGTLFALTTYATYALS